jgi:hypothetical protein
MGKYQYSELKSPTSIRLLRLLPKETDPGNLRCELFDFALEDVSGQAPIYEALSYVWGSKQNLKSIILDNQSFDITPNLFSALQHLRDDKFPRVIWVDAVCINQNDTEKESQIALMAEIYAKASRVVIWLGDSDGNDDPFAAIRLAAQCSTGHSAAGAFNAEVCRQNIPQLLERPWFQRIWVRIPSLKLLVEKAD